MMTDLLLLLAQTSAPTSQPAQGPGGVLGGPMIPLILMIVVFWFIMSRGKNKERKRFENMLAAMKKGDKVQTIGGVFGTIVDVRDNEVVVKVDESANVKIRFNRGAIKEVIQETPAETK